MQVGADADDDGGASGGGSGRSEEEFLDDLEAELRRARTGRGRRSTRPRATPPPRPRGRRVLPLEDAGSLIGELRSAADGYADRPSQQLLLGTLALLVGFYVAQGLTPGIVGQGGYWEYVAGGVTIFVVERITTSYYSRPLAARSPTLRLVHAFKVGFVYGCVLDALKLGV